MRTKAQKIKEAEEYKGSSAREWRSLFGFSIVRESDGNRLSLSHYNKKVSALQFNLMPGATCPGSTAMCQSRGYCRKVEYDNVLAMFRRNTETAHKPETFKTLMASALDEYVRHGGRWFRYHSYGDIFSQEYLNSILEMAESFPQIQFLAHTKSYWLDYSRKPDNFAVYFSVFPDSSTNLEWHSSGNIPLAIAGDISDYGGSRERLASRAVTCPAGCKGCRLCWQGKVNVRFHWH